MYLQYWGIDIQPFGNVPHRGLFFYSPQHEEALNRMIYAVEQHKGAAMLTGEVGLGKTTVSRTLIYQLTKGQYNFLAIINPALTSIDLIRAILLKTGGTANGDSKTVLLEKLQTRLLQNLEQGHKNILIIDEAHTISDRSAFEELRMLLNMQLEDQYLVSLILLGQPPLRDKVSALKPLSERIAVKYHLEPLDLENTLHYVRFRLKSAGASRGIFTSEAIQALHDYSEGIPLKINNICDRSLLIGMIRNDKVISMKTVREAVEDLK